MVLQLPTILTPRPAATIYFITQFCAASIRESGYYSRAAFIKLGTEDEDIHCLKQGGVAADARESIQRYTATLATVTYTQLEESDPCADVEENEEELEENELVLEDC